MFKSFCKAVSIVFSLIALAELTKVDGWEMATLFQRVCVIWSIGVLLVMIYLLFCRLTRDA